MVYLFNYKESNVVCIWFFDFLYQYVKYQAWNTHFYNFYSIADDK